MKNWLKKYDILTRGLALLIAVVLWIYVVTVIDPIGERTISNITPTYIGSEELEISSNLSVGNKEGNVVDVKLTGNRRALAAVNENNVRVEVDLSKIREEGIYTLAYDIRLPSGDLTVASRTPDRLTVKIDKIVDKVVPVELVFEGTIAEGYIAGDSYVAPKVLSVSGRTEEVEKIACAKVVIAKKDLNTSIATQMEYSFYDADGNIIHPQLTESVQRTVEVTYPVLKTREVKLGVELVPGGGAQEKNVSYEITPSVITIAGAEKDVEQFDDPFIIGVVELSKYSATTTIPLNITMKEGIKNISGETSAQVNLSFNGLYMKNIETNAIEINNTPGGYKIEPLTNTVSVLVRGSEADIAKVLSNNVRVVVDLSGTVLAPGQHTVTGHAIVDGVGNVGAVGEYKVLVKVSK